MQEKFQNDIAAAIFINSSTFLLSSLHPPPPFELHIPTKNITLKPISYLYNLSTHCTSAYRVKVLFHFTTKEGK